MHSAAASGPKYERIRFRRRHGILFPQRRFRRNRIQTSTWLIATSVAPKRPPCVKPVRLELTEDAGRAYFVEVAFMDSVIDVLAAKIRNALRSAGGTLSGPTLGSLLTAADRATYQQEGLAKLGDFVRKHLAGEVVVEPGGVFRLAQAGSTDGAAGASRGGYPSANTQPKVVDLFKTWKSPGSPHRLRITVSGGEVVEARQVLRGTAPVDSEYELEVLDNAAHMQIARNFVETEMPESLREAFLLAISETDQHWWQRWNEMFTASAVDFPDGQRKWLSYRHRGLVDALKDALRKGGVEGDAVDNACKRILEPAAPKAAGPGGAKGSSGGAAARLDDGLHELSFRDVILGTIEQISDEDLRRLWLPAGILFDLARVPRPPR